MSKIAVNPDFQGDSGEPRPRPASAPPVSYSSPIDLYKSGRGVYVRWCTAAGAGILLLAGGNFIYEQLGRVDFGQSLIWRYVIPLVLVALGAYGIFLLCGRNRRLVDFFIATEDEMRKVNWSTRREVAGATRIVIFVLLLLGFILFFVDIIFMFFFQMIGVLRVGTLTSLFGGGG